jgi:hypothetical protein
LPVAHVRAGRRYPYVRGHRRKASGALEEGRTRPGGAAPSVHSKDIEEWKPAPRRPVAHVRAGRRLPYIRRTSKNGSQRLGGRSHTSGPGRRYPYVGRHRRMEAGGPAAGRTRPGRAAPSVRSKGIDDQGRRLRRTAFARGRSIGAPRTRERRTGTERDVTPKNAIPLSSGGSASAAGRAEGAPAMRARRRAFGRR